MAESTGIPTVDLGAALDALGLQDASLVSSETRASDTRVWRVSQDGRDLAIRVFRPDQKTVMRAELQAMEIAFEHGIPVPRTITSGTIDGTHPVMAIEWMQGEIVGDSLVGDPDSAEKLGIASGQVLARLHEIPTPSGARSGHLTGSWIERAVRDDSELRALLENVQVPELRLLHLDYHPFNLLASNGSVSGIIDWTNAAIGDPRADIARSTSTMELLAPMYVGRVPERIAACQQFARGLLEGYQARRGSLENMAPFHAWAGNLIMTDLRPKLQSLPTTDPEGFMRMIEAWTEHWRQQAFDATN